MKVGDRVSISAAGRGVDVGTVEDLRTVVRLPWIAGAPDPGVVRDIFCELGVTRVAIISHRGGTLIFAALERACGEWYDLRGQKLTISSAEAVIQ